MMPATDSDEPDADEKHHLLGFGFFDLVRKRMLSPVFAWRAASLWRVLIRGNGFIVHLEPPLGDVVGFYVTYFVAALTRKEAMARALQRAEAHWTASEMGKRACGKTAFEIDETEEIQACFKWRSRSGYVFYGEE